MTLASSTPPAAAAAVGSDFSSSLVAPDSKIKSAFCASADACVWRDDENLASHATCFSMRDLTSASDLLACSNLAWCVAAS